ncbi:MAG: patatin-like phospholipase family protein [Clostridiales bacterium]|nr:patatin-like phospholipase family protein [Clostridiales bacterium]
MEKKFDPGRTYAIALGGGGAKGGYEVGAIKALMEEGLVYNAVSGTSVGALNGALLAMRDVERAEDLWRNIKYSQVMDVDDDEMSRVFDKDVTAHELRPLLRRAINIVRGGGFDVTPLRNLLKQYVDPKKIKNSDVDFVAVTYSITDKKEVVADVRSLPEDDICDMLLASAYFPAFKNEPLVGGKRFTDGGVSDVLPITPLIDRGYRNIIAIKLTGGLGRERYIRPRKDLDLSYICPKRRLGNTLNFSTEQSAYNLSLGYYDAKRMIWGLTGDYYYLERTISERQAYRELMDLIAVETRAENDTVSLRAVHESIIPRLAKEHGADGDYYDVLIKYLEHTGEVFKIPEFRIIKDTVLLSEVKGELKKRGVATITPKAFKS